MKKVLFTLMLTASALLLFSACNKKDNDSANEIKPGDITNSELTPGEHKSKLEEIALEFVNMYDTKDVDALVESAIALEQYMEDFTYGGSDDDYLDARSLIRGLREFSATDITLFATRAAENFVIDINDPDTNIYAGKCFTYEDYEWIVTDGDPKSVVFKWDDTVATISWDGSKKIEYLVESEDVNYVVYVPSTIEVSITINGKEHLGITLNTNITDLKTWAPSVDIRLNGGYTFASEVSGNSKGLEAKSSAKKDSKVLLAGKAVVAINDFTDIDNWIQEEYDDYYDETYTYLDPSMYFAENVKSGSAQIDILELSIVASGDFKGMYEEMLEYDEKYDYYDDEWNYLPDVAEKYYNKVCDCINDNVSVVIVYNDTKEKVADIVMNVASYYDDYDEAYRYYLEPILLFPDGSKFAFEEYFTERAFGNLIDRLEQMAEHFDDLY